MKVTRGRVVSVKMQKTAVVLVQTHKTHPLYGKSFVYSTKYLVDDPIGVSLGDIVEFEKCKPISLRKHWKVIRVVGRDIKAIEEEVMKEVAERAIEEVMPEEKEENVEVQSDEVVDKAKRKGDGQKKSRAGKASNVSESTEKAR